MSKQTPNPKTSFGTRAVSGLVFAALAVGATVWREWSFYAFWGLVGLLCVWEFYRLVSKAFVGTTVRGRILWLVLGTLYILVPIALLAALDPSMSWDGGNGKMVVTLLFVVWMNDVGAYIIGVSTGGRHKMAPAISPNKSWEGFFGGLLFGVATALVLYGLYWAGNAERDMFLGEQWVEKLKWLGLGLVASLAGVGGDLIESKFKRVLGVKDSGRAIPGHGGFLDRFDALLVAIPVVWVYIRLTELI